MIRLFENTFFVLSVNSVTQDKLRTPAISLGINMDTYGVSQVSDHL